MILNESVDILLGINDRKLQKTIIFEYPFKGAFKFKKKNVTALIYYM